MDFYTSINKGFLDERVLSEFNESNNVKKPGTLLDEISKIQWIKKQNDLVKRPDEIPIQVVAYYYVLPKKDKNSYGNYFYTQNNIIILKAPQSVLGENVLGTANLNTKIIKILETLQGCAFEEVLKHELNHIKYPYLDEYRIREMTRTQLTHYPIFH